MLSARDAAVRLVSRVLEPVRWRHVGVMFGLALLLALQWDVNGVATAWRDGEIGGWLLSVCAAFTSFAAIGVTLALPMLAAGVFGPADGWRRVCLLVIVVAFVALPLAALVRAAYVMHVYNLSFDPLRRLLLYWPRYLPFVALTASAFEYLRHRMRNQERQHAAELDRVALERDEADAVRQVLQAQIEPHFLFNTLATVRRLYQTDPTAGRAMLDHLMRYLEVALPRMRGRRNTLADERDLIESFLEMHRIRMGERLAFEIDMPADLARLDLPPMMLLTLVENSIKHGLGPLPEGGALEVRARRSGDRLEIEANDTGQGFTESQSAGGGIGVANVRARLAAEFGGAAGLELTDNRPRGVRARLWLPAREASGAT